MEQFVLPLTRIKTPAELTEFIYTSTYRLFWVSAQIDKDKQETRSGTKPTTKGDLHTLITAILEEGYTAIITPVPIGDSDTM